LPIPDDLSHDNIAVLHDGWAALMISAVAKVDFLPASLIKYRQHSRQQLGVSSSLNTTAARQTVPRMAAFSSSLRRKNNFAAEIHYLETINERLLANSGKFACAEALATLRNRIKHLRARAKMSERRLTRVALVLKELLSLRYHRYSNGLASALKDIWLADLNEKG
jgi:hypothetical protein